MQNENKIKVAILDMYKGTPNQGMRAIQSLLKEYGEHLSYKIYDVRSQAEVPDLSYDLYISTGGPGDPRRGNGVWDPKYYAFIDSVMEFNKSAEQPKYLFLICHSFQMICRHLGVGKITKRHQKSFGTFSVHKTEAGSIDRLFLPLKDPFTVADFRLYQVLSPDHEKLAELGAKILLLEKDRPHVPYERAIMGIRFSDHIVALQFHPEADAEGMYAHFTRRGNKKMFIESIGEDRYGKLIEDLKDPEHIEKTHKTILPRFIEEVVESRSLVFAQ